MTNGAFLLDACGAYNRKTALVNIVLVNNSVCSKRENVFMTSGRSQLRVQVSPAALYVGNGPVSSLQHTTIVLLLA